MRGFQNLQAGQMDSHLHKKYEFPSGNPYFLFALGQLPKPLFVLLLQLKDALFFGICIIWCRFCEERQQSRAKLIAGFIGWGKRIGGGNDGIHNLFRCD